MIDFSAGYLHGGHADVDHLSLINLSQINPLGCSVAKILEN